MARGISKHATVIVAAFIAVAAAHAASPTLPRNAPVPEFATRPVPAGPQRQTAKPADRADSGKPTAMPPDELACRALLISLGVTFAEERPLSDDSGCSSPYPLQVSKLGAGLTLDPPAIINCATAQRLADFTHHTVVPEVRKAFGQDLKGLRQASGYVCRSRNGSQKLSEHAFGNAIDIAAFVLQDGSEIAVEATREPDRSVFLSRVRSAACGPFTTVLGPGSDPDHATHFHWDLAKRRKGSAFCQ